MSKEVINAIIWFLSGFGTAVIGFCLLSIYYFAKDFYNKK